jgi:hypothetical protein
VSGECGVCGWVDCCCVTTAPPDMRLRDYFAAQALTMLADPAVKVGGEGASEVLARLCYEIADAMLAERAK